MSINGEEDFPSETAPILGVTASTAAPVLSSNHEAGARVAAHGFRRPHPVLLVILNMFSGAAMGYNGSSAGLVLKFIRKSQGPDSVKEWLASSFIIAVGVGLVASCFFSSLVTDSLGRKKAIFIAEVTVFVFSTLQAVVPFPWQIPLRVLLGVGMGLCVVAKPLYTTEVAHESQRGLILSFFSWGYSVGIIIALGLDGALVSFQVPPNVAWRLMLAVGGLPAIVILLTLTQCDESPEWRLLRASGKQGGGVGQRSGGCCGGASIFKSAGAGRATVVCFAFLLAHQMTGIALLTADTEQILGVAMEGNAKKEASVAEFAVVFGVIHLLGVTTGLVAQGILSRRAHVLTSLSLMVLSLAMCVAFFAMNREASWVKWGRVVALGIFMYVFQLGVAPLFWLMVNELFPSEHRAVGASAFVAAALLTGLVLSFMGPFLTEALLVPLYLGFLMCAIFAWIVLWIFLPETKNRTLEEVQVELASAFQSFLVPKTACVERKTPA